MTTFLIFFKNSVKYMCICQKGLKHAADIQIIILIVRYWPSPITLSRICQACSLIMWRKTARNFLCIFLDPLYLQHWWTYLQFITNVTISVACCVWLVLSNCGKNFVTYNPHFYYIHVVGFSGAMETFTRKRQSIFFPLLFDNTGKQKITTSKQARCFWTLEFSFAAIYQEVQ